MKNLIERSILAGIGLFSQTREKSQVSAMRFLPF